MEKTALWYKEAVFYEVNVRAFYDSNGDGHGDLRGVMQKLDVLQALGVDCLWLMPIYPSPLRDDGYDISDYCAVLPEYGNLDDFRTLVQAAHTRGMRVITDLVVNHTSDQHPWFQAARQDRSSPYRDYYVWSDSGKEYAGARIIFLDTESSNWTWDEAAGQYFWHRFYSTQPDLNFDNPAVQQEMLDVMRFWIDQGIDGFRVDAVPYLIEREGTICENLPETHAYLKRMRAFVEEYAPGTLLLCEANQWPEDVRPYFGDNDQFQMGFHFPLMPRLYMALRKADRSPLEWILGRTPPIPPDCQWCIFLRNHDELTLEMVTEAERQWMWEQYAPDPRMRINLGIRRRLAPLLDNDRRRIELLNSLLFSLPGSPILYYGDEIGMGDNIWLFDRNGVRTPMQWSAGPNAGFSSAPAEKLYAPVIDTPPFTPQQVNLEQQQADPGSLWNTLRRMIAVRKAHPGFVCGALEWLELEQKAVAGFWRVGNGERLLALHNLSEQPQTLSVPLPEGFGRAEDLLQQPGLKQPKLQQPGLPPGETPSGAGDLLTLTLAPYAYRWLRMAP